MKQRLADSYKKLRATNILSNFFNLSGIQLSNMLLLLLIIPVFTRSIGITEFGIVMFASRFSLLSGGIVNWGTSQSAVRDVAVNLNDKKKLSSVVYNTLFIRGVIFCLFLAVLYALQWFSVPFYNYLVWSVPMVLAEVFNPLCFFIGAERLRVFNIFNLLINVLCIISLLLFVKNPADAVWINFILGFANVITYAGLLIHFGVVYKLSAHLPLKNEILKISRNNFYLTVNGVSVNLQQSIIIFALPRWGYALLLGPYSLSDRVIGQCRVLLTTLSNAIYPNAARMYQQGGNLWNAYRKKIKHLTTVIFFVGGIVIFLLADFIVRLLLKQHDATAVMFLKIMAFVPTASALNVLNVLDQLLKNRNVYIFRIALILLGIALVTVVAVLRIGNPVLIGSFTLIVETCAWLLYEFMVKRSSAVKNA